MPCIVALVLVPVLLIVAWYVVTHPMRPAQESGSQAKVDPALLEGHVRALSERFVPRDEGHPENLDRAAAYVREAFEGTSGRTSEQVFRAGGRTYRNVVSEFGPQTGERIVVGAHYDTAGELPGADDNASGVAGLIALARLLDGAPLPMTVELVAYTLEEPPFFRTAWMGSAVHARGLREAGRTVRVMISLEMIGCFSDEVGSQRFPLPLLRLFYPSRGSFIAVVGRLRSGREVRAVKGAMAGATPLPVYSFNGPPLVPGVDLSDHLSYWRNGYRAVMITDTAFYRNRHYHAAQDTAEKLDYERMALVVAGVYEAVLALAE